MRCPLCVALVLPLLAGCVTTAEQGRRMQAEIQDLQHAIDAERARNQAQDARIEEGLSQIDAKLAEVSRAMEALGLAARKNDADFGATLDGMIADIQSLRGAVEELKFRADRLESSLNETREEMRSKVEEVKTTTSQELEALKGDEAVAKLQARKKAKTLAEKGDRARLLAMAEGRLKEGEYDLARQIAQDYLKRWPDDPQAGGVQLLLAESYFRAKQYRPAILEYNKFREKYPKHPLMPGALFNIGEAFAALNLKPEAGRFWDAVIRRYPKSKAAQKARKRKRELKLK